MLMFNIYLALFMRAIFNFLKKDLHFRINIVYNVTERKEGFYE